MGNPLQNFVLHFSSLNWEEIYITGDDHGSWGWWTGSWFQVKTRWYTRVWTRQTGDPLQIFILHFWFQIERRLWSSCWLLDVLVSQDYIPLKRRRVVPMHEPMKQVIPCNFYFAYVGCIVLWVKFESLEDTLSMLDFEWKQVECDFYVEITPCYFCWTWCGSMRWLGFLGNGHS